MWKRSVIFLFIFQLILLETTFARGNFCVVYTPDMIDEDLREELANNVVQSIFEPEKHGGIAGFGGVLDDGQRGIMTRNIVKYLKLYSAHTGTSLDNGCVQNINQGIVEFYGGSVENLGRLNRTLQNCYSLVLGDEFKQFIHDHVKNMHYVGECDGVEADTDIGFWSFPGANCNLTRVHPQARRLRDIRDDDAEGDDRDALTPRDSLANYIVENKNEDVLAASDWGQQPEFLGSLTPDDYAIDTAAHVNHWLTDISDNQTYVLYSPMNDEYDQDDVGGVVSANCRAIKSNGREGPIASGSPPTCEDIATDLNHPNGNIATAVDSDTDGEENACFDQKSLGYDETAAQILVDAYGDGNDNRQYRLPGDGSKIGSSDEFLGIPALPPKGTEVQET